MSTADQDKLRSEHYVEAIRYMDIANEIFIKAWKEDDLYNARSLKS